MILPNEKGVILFICFWILVILTIFTLSIAQGVRLNLKFAKYHQDRLKSLYIAKAGIIKVLVELEKDSNNWDGLCEFWATGIDANKDKNIFKDIELGEGKFTVKITDEDSKININYASPDLLMNIFELSGLESEVAQDLVDTITKWRILQHKTCVLEELNSLKKFKANPNNLAKTKDYVTVYGDNNFININTASPLVVEAVLKTFSKDSEEVGSLKEKIISFRQGQDGIEGNEDDQVFENNNISQYLNLNAQESALAQRLSSNSKVKSHIFRVLSFANLNSGKAMRIIEAVLERSPITNRIEKIVYWHEN